MNWNEHESQNLEHRDNPRPGDYWEDHLCPVCVVLDASRFAISYCRKTKDVGSDRWAWDLSAIETMTPKDFKVWLTYTSMDKTWASCHPESQLDVVKHALETIK